jgi:hypothetical protein
VDGFADLAGVLAEPSAEFVAGTVVAGVTQVSPAP